MGEREGSGGERGSTGVDGCWFGRFGPGGWAIVAANAADREERGGDCINVTLCGGGRGGEGRGGVGRGGEVRKKKWGRVRRRREGGEREGVSNCTFGGSNQMEGRW